MIFLKEPNDWPAAESLKEVIDKKLFSDGNRKAITAKWNNYA